MAASASEEVGEFYRQPVAANVKVEALRVIGIVDDLKHRVLVDGRITEIVLACRAAAESNGCMNNFVVKWREANQETRP